MAMKAEEALAIAKSYTAKSLEGAGALKGQDGKDGVSPVISVNTSTADTYKLDITDKNGTITTPNLVGKQGLQGVQGEQGKNADNPIVTENPNNTEDVYKLDLTVGETVFTTKNIIGKQGLEGVSPSVTTNPDNTTEDYRLNITTKGGTFTTPNLRGPQGEIGPQGESAASAINPRGDYDVNADPHYTISDYITSAEGNTYVCKKDNPDNVAPTDGTVNDEFWQILALRGAQGIAGKDGEKGADGVTFTPSIDENGVLSFTNNGGLENPEPIDIRGDNGVTFTPSIDAEGYLSFTNDGNLENPEPIKVLGKDGADGRDGIDGTTYIPSIGTVTTVENNADASAGVTVNEETKEAVFHFEIPKGASGENAVQFTPSITENGELAWENDGDLPNPPTTPIQTLISTAPLGTVLSFAGSTAPNGYLLCDGKSYAVADYEDLYAVIGNTYGGDSTNFNVPNLIDKFIQGSTTSGTEKEAGLPNIEGSFGQFRLASAVATGSGAFRLDSGTSRSISGYDSTTNQNKDVFSFDASRSNAIYGNSDTVQPPALTMVYIIKAFHTNEGVDEGVSDDVVDYVDSELATKLDKGYTAGIADANDAIGENGVNIFVMSASSANMPLSRTGIIRSYVTIEDKYIRVNQEYSTIDNAPQIGGTYKRYGASDDGGVTFTWSNWNFIGSIDDSTTASLRTWSSSKIASEISAKITKTQYRGSQSIDISTSSKLTLIYSSMYASQAGCYMLLSNYNTTPLLIELGKFPQSSFNVTATNKSFGVDTITVTTASDEYSWYVLQF